MCSLSMTWKQFKSFCLFNQMARIANRNYQIGRSQFFHSLCRGTRCVLSERKRSNQIFFDLFSFLGEGGSRFDLSLAEQVKQARRDFPKRGDAR